jgi:hypothetical protein
MVKELRINLRDETAEALEAEVAAGEAASISDLIEAALEAYLFPGMPSVEEMLADAAEVEAEIAAGGPTYTAEEVLAHIRETLRR